MRSEYSKKSAISAVIANGIKIVLSFFSQKLFILYIGTKLLGLNGLFNNIISMLAITELGLGSAIIYNLYEPIANNDQTKIKQLVNFYKKSYRIICFVIFAIALIILPFIQTFAGTDIKYVYLYYLLFVSDALLSYAVAYKVSLINAYQKNYIINYIHIIYLIVMNIAQISLIFIFKSYFLYLIVKILSRIFENIMISHQYNKSYRWLDEVNTTPLDSQVKTDIVSKVKALFFHKASNFLVAGTDNIIISKIFGLVTVGLYSNYCMIITAIQSLFQQMFSSIVASVGNLLTEKNKEKSYHVYLSLLLVNFFITSFCSLCLFFMIEPFITIWIGKEFLFNRKILFVLIIVFYSTGMRNASNSFKNAAGIFVEDRFVPLIESFVNLSFSIILALKFGLIGVFIGTFISTLVLHLYSYPKYVYNKLFDRKKIGYIWEQVTRFILFLFEFGIIFFITKHISISNLYLQLIVNLIICTVVSFSINIFVFRKTEEFKYIMSKISIKKFIKKEGK